VSLGFTSVDTITISVAGLLILLAVIALARSIVLRGKDTNWRRIRLGFFVERNHLGDHKREDHDEPSG